MISIFQKYVSKNKSSVNFDNQSIAIDNPLEFYIQRSIRKKQIFTFIYGINESISYGIKSKDGKVKFPLSDQRNENCINCEICIYHPEIFKQFRDKELKYFKYSFNLIENEKHIATLSELDGGKSGEFLYQTYDEKIIIKTISNEDLNTFLEIWPQYSNYLEQNPNSLIAKIYGLYTFERMDTQLHVIVMSNIGLGVPQSYIQRKFDLKGSTYDRQVIKDNNYNVNLTRMTLKDIDFLKTELQVWIESKDSQKIYKQLIDDSNFLKSQNLMDYSLLVMKIDWGQCIKEKNSSYKKVFASVNNPLSCTVSKNEPGIYYHVAIIDYLQEWNTKKLTEKLLKKIKTMDSDLNNSSQDSETYANRFRDNLLKQIFDFQLNNDNPDQSNTLITEFQKQSQLISLSISQSHYIIL